MTPKQIANWRGNCYTVCEALYHLMGGKAAGLTPMVMHHEGGTHWFLKHTSGFLNSQVIIDPTVSQFKSKPDYSLARGCGFLTKQPSKRAKKLMNILLYRKVF